MFLPRSSDSAARCTQGRLRRRLLGGLLYRRAVPTGLTFAAVKAKRRLVGRILANEGPPRGFLPLEGGIPTGGFLWGW